MLEHSFWIDATQKIICRFVSNNCFAQKINFMLLITIMNQTWINGIVDIVVERAESFSYYVIFLLHECIKETVDNSALILYCLSTLSRKRFTAAPIGTYFPLSSAMKKRSASPRKIVCMNYNFCVFLSSKSSGQEFLEIFFFTATVFVYLVLESTSNINVRP